MLTRKSFLPLTVCFFIAMISHAVAAPLAKAGLNLDHTNISALSAFTYEESTYATDSKSSYGGVTRNLSFKKSSTALTVSYIVIQDSTKSPTSVIQGHLGTLCSQSNWRLSWSKDTSHHTTLGDERWAENGTLNATAVHSQLFFSRSNIVVNLSCSDAALDLKPLAVEIDNIIKALPNINYSDIGNHKPSLTLTPEAPSMSVNSSLKLTVSTSDPNSHAVTTHHDSNVQEGLSITTASYGYDANSNLYTGTFTVKIVAINAIGLYVEKSVTYTVTP